MNRYYNFLKCVVKTKLAVLIQFRTDFFLKIITTSALELIFPLVTFLIYSKGLAFEGYNFYEILLLQSVFMLSQAIGMLFFFGIIIYTLESVRNGTYEFILLYPGNTVLIIIMKSLAIEIDNITALFTWLILCVYSLIHLPAFSLINYALFILVFFAGIIFSLGISLLLGGTAFTWVGNSRIFHIYDSIAAFGKYPAGIFPKFLRVIISYIIPVAIIAYYPVNALFGRYDVSFVYITLASILFVFLSYRFYMTMLKSYTSAGG